MRTQLPKLCSQDLLNNLFRHPYTRIQFVRDDLSVTPQTAAAYYINTGGINTTSPCPLGQCAAAWPEC